MFAVVDMIKHKTLSKVGHREDAEALADLYDKLVAGPRPMVIKTLY